MRFWRSDDQRIQWLAAKFGNYLVDANARFAASSKWRSVMSISTLVNAIDNLAKETKPKHVSAPCPQNYKRRAGNWTPVGRIGEPRKSIRGKEMNITDPIYADEDKAREHSDSLQATEPVDQGNGRRVQHRNAVPQDVSIRCANNQRTLADRKLWLCSNADYSRLVLAE